MRWANAECVKSTRIYLYRNGPEPSERASGEYCDGMGGAIHIRHESPRPAQRPGELILATDSDDNGAGWQAGNVLA